MSKFVSGAFDLVAKECLTTILVKEMDVSHLIFHAQRIEGDKLKEQTRDSNMARTDNGDVSHSKSNRGNHFQGKGSSEKMVSECQMF